MTDLEALITANAIRWHNMVLTRHYVATAKSLVAAKPHYQRVEALTGVPWFVIAVSHERESGQSWERQLAQGDLLSRVSVHVPKGRGPFKTWDEGAVDALVHCPPYASKWDNWTIGGTLCLLEQYNGLGYAARGIPSPYIWSGSNQYSRGKYISDGVFNANAVDVQPGCAVLLKEMMDLDPSITFHKPTPKAPEEAHSKPESSANFWATLLNLIINLFKGK